MKGAHLISSQSLNLGGRRGTTDDAATIPFHPSLTSAALRESPNPIPVHSLMLSSHLFFCLPLLLAPFTIPCRIVFAMPEALGMWPYHLSFRFFTMVRRSSCTPVAFWILLRTSSHHCPFRDVFFPSLLLSFSPFCSFYCSLQNCLRHAKVSWEVAIPSDFPFLYHG